MESWTYEDMTVTFEQAKGFVWIVRISANNTLLDSLTGTDVARLNRWAEGRCALMATWPLLRRDKAISSHVG